MARTTLVADTAPSGFPWEAALVAAVSEEASEEVAAEALVASAVAALAEEEPVGVGSYQLGVRS